MDIRIVTLIVLLSVVGSFADVELPYVRMRRNGLQESDAPSLVAEHVGIPRTKRDESVGSSTIESTGTPKSTADPTTAATRSTSSAKPDSTGSSSSKPSPTNDPATRSSTPIPKPSPRSGSASKNTSPKPTTSPAPTEATTKSKKPTNPGKPTSPGKPTDPGTSTSPFLAPRIDSSQNEAQEPAKKPHSMTPVQPRPSGGNPDDLVNGNLPYFVPDFTPYFSSLSSLNGDSTFNSIPGPNYAQTGTVNGGGMASSFASASAGGFGSSGYDTKQPTFGVRGAFVDNVPNVANTPDSSYTPSVVNSGGFGFVGGDIPFVDPYQFSQYNLEQFQRQMHELQMQFQRQQQELNERFNRIYSDPSYTGGIPGGHSAVSSINLGPEGGYQSGAINPASPGIESRFGEALPPPSGNNYAVFSSSSSKTMRGPDGKITSHKTSSTGVNDNGKITFRTIEE
ncbi:uncharacterized protein LOC143149197 [Ptiloglossa arizonensis]|uniref:uncharacterized protein LOC143149197 n=1 Tax=Ptiloglossa arizonensis TaxID=3350558 RepID=UPI003FA16279